MARTETTTEAAERVATVLPAYLVPDTVMTLDRLPPAPNELVHAGPVATPLPCVAEYHRCDAPLAL